MFIYHFNKKTFFEALRQCSSSQQNGDQSPKLLVIDRPEINTAVVNHMTKIGVGQNGLSSIGYWIAGSDVEVEGDWRWSDAKKSVIPTKPGQTGFQKWYRQGGRNEPRSTLGDEDCLYISNSIPLLGFWFSINCDSKKYFICQVNSPRKFKSSVSLKIS